MKFYRYERENPEQLCIFEVWRPDLGTVGPCEEPAMGRVGANRYLCHEHLYFAAGAKGLSHKDMILERKGK